MTIASDRAAGPRPHGIYSDRDRHGNPRISVTASRKGRRGGRRLKTLVGHCRNIALPYLAHIFFDHPGCWFAFESGSLSHEYHTISEDAAIHMMLLMDAVRNEPRYEQAQAMAQAIAGMNHCEAKWWYAHHTMRTRDAKRTSSRVMRALALMHTET